MIFVARYQSNKTVEEEPDPPHRDIPCRKHLLNGYYIPKNGRLGIPKFSYEDITLEFDCLYCNKRYKGCGKVKKNDGHEVVIDGYGDIYEECTAGASEESKNIKELVCV